MREEFDELLGLELSIANVEDATMAEGEDAYIIYLKVDNKTSKNRKINLLKATYIGLAEKGLSY